MDCTEESRLGFVVKANDDWNRIEISFSLTKLGPEVRQSPVEWNQVTHEGIEAIGLKQPLPGCLICVWQQSFVDFNSHSLGSVGPLIGDIFWYPKDFAIFEHSLYCEKEEKPTIKRGLSLSCVMNFQYLLGAFSMMGFVRWAPLKKSCFDVETKWKVPLSTSSSTPKTASRFVACFWLWSHPIFPCFCQRHRLKLLL